MSRRLISIAFILVGILLILLNSKLKPFDSDFEGPLVIILEFSGPLILILGLATLSYETYYFFKNRAWPDVIPNSFLIISITIGVIASIIFLVYRFMA